MEMVEVCRDALRAGEGSVGEVLRYLVLPADGSRSPFPSSLLPILYASLC